MTPHLAAATALLEAVPMAAMFRDPETGGVIFDAPDVERVAAVLEPFFSELLTALANCASALNRNGFEGEEMDEACRLTQP